MNQAVNADWQPEADPEYGRALIPYMLRRYRWMLLGGLLLGGLVFGIASLFAPPVYSTSGSLHITKSAGGGGIMGGLAGLAGGAPLPDERQIIVSREIGWQVIDELGLQADVYDPRSGDAAWQRVLGKLGLSHLEGTREEQYSRLTIRDVEVSPDMLSSKQRWISADAEGNWRSDRRSGQAGERLESPDYGFLPRTGPMHREGDRYLLTIRPDHEAWAAYLSSLSVTRAGLDTSMLSVRFAHHNPLVAKQVVDLILEKYLDYTYQITYGNYDVLLAFVADETAAAQQRLDQRLADLADYQEEHRVYQETAQGASAIQSLAALSRQQTETRIQLLQIDSVLAMIDSRSPAEISATIQAPATSLPIEAELVSQLADSVRGLEDARQTRTEAHPEVVRLQQQISTVLGQIADSLKSARQAHQLAASGVAGDIGRLRSELTELPEASGGIALLRGEIEADQQILALLKEQETQTKLQRASTSTDVRVLDYPPMPARRDSPRVMRDGLLGVAAGALAAILLALLIETWHRGFRTLRELRRGLGIPVLAVLEGPAIRGRWQPCDQDSAPPARLWRLFEQRRPLAVVQLDAGHPNYDLAWALSAAGKENQQALLIDCDSLGARLFEALKQEPGRGLTELADQPSDLAGATVRLDNRRALLAWGDAELSAMQLERLAMELTGKFSHIIACLPPPGQWVQPERLKPLLAQCVLTVAQGGASRTEIGAALSILRQLGAMPRGIIVTNFAAARDPLAREELPQVLMPPPGRR